MALVPTIFAKSRNVSKPEYAKYSLGYHGNKVSPTYFVRSEWKVKYKPIGPGAIRKLTAGNPGDSFIQFPFESELIPFHNKALRKIDDKLRTADSFFEDWYERQQAYQLLYKTGLELLRFVRNYKNPKYYKKLKKDFDPVDLPSAWLAFNFGVKPMVGSVDRAMNLLGADFPVWKVNAASQIKIKNREHKNSQSGFNEAIIYTDWSGFYQIGTRVTGINPNRALAGALGLNEPFSSVWNVLPWGWAVDYFANVGELLSNMENKHPGIQTTDWYTTTFFQGKMYSNHIGPPWEEKFFDYGITGDAFQVHRTPTPEPMYGLEYSFPLLGSSKLANLFSAIAITMKGKSR